MASRNIKGITIEINGDATGLDKALQGVNKDLKRTQSALKDVDKLLKLDPGNTELLRQKQKLLGDAIKDVEKKLQTEKEALKQLKAADQSPEVQRQMETLERQIVDDEQALKRLQQESKDFGSVAKQQFKAAADKMKEVGKKVEEVGKKLQDVGGKMTKSVTTPIVAVGTASVAAFKTVDSGMDTMIKKTGASGEALEEMQGILEDIVTSIPTDFETAGSAIGEVNTRFGLTGDALKELSEQFIMFADLNDTDVSTAIDSTQKALEAFGLGAEDAGSLLDVMNKVAQDSGISVETLSGGLVTNSAAFQELGLSIDQSAAFMGQMEKSGADVESVMGGLKKALKNAKDEGIPLDEALSQLQDTIKNGTGDVDGLTAAYDIFGKKGDEIYEAVKNGGLDFEEFGSKANEAVGSVSDTFAATQDPIDEFTTTMNELKLIGADLGAALMEQVAPALEMLSEKIGEVRDWWNQLNPETQEAVIKFGGLAAVIGPLIMIAGSLVTAIGALLSPIGLFVAAIPIAIWQVKEFWRTLTQSFQIIKDFVAKAGEQWNQMKTVIVAAWDRMKTATSIAWDAIKNFVSSKIQGIKDTISNVFGAIKGVATKVWEDIKFAITHPIEAAKNTISNLVGGIKALFSGEWSLPRIKLPHFSIEGSFSLSPPSIPHISVSWYRKAYDQPYLFTTPTVMSSPVGLRGFGDGNGGEIVYGRDQLMRDISAVSISPEQIYQAMVAALASADMKVVIGNREFARVLRDQGVMTI